MKKFAIVLIIFLIILNGVEKKDSFSLLNYFSGDYLVYTSENEGSNSVNLGFCYMDSDVKDVKNIIGESMTINNFEVGSALKTLSARVVKTECLEDGTIVIYAFSNLIGEKVEIGGEKVNLQIATRDEISVIGWPLILGSY